MRNLTALPSTLGTHVDSKPDARVCGSDRPNPEALPKIVWNSKGSTRDYSNTCGWQHFRPMLRDALGPCFILLLKKSTKIICLCTCWIACPCKWEDMLRFIEYRTRSSYLLIWVFLPPDERTCLYFCFLKKNKMFTKTGFCFCTFGIRSPPANRRCLSVCK